MKKLTLFLCLGFIFAQKPNVINFVFQPFDSRPYLTPTPQPKNSININWNTSNKESTIVAYGLTLQLADTARISGIHSFHHVILSSLSPATEYYYRVLPDGDIKTFKTFPVHADSFNFIVFGDTRSDAVSHQSVIDRMANYDFDFIINSGDLVGSGDNTNDWQTFFNIEDTLLQSKLFLPTIGNHERPYILYDTLFALPDAKYFYSVNYGNAHFIILNTQMDLYGAQRNWLINDLIAVHSDTSINWIFVSLHSPPYSLGSHGSDKMVRQAWCPIFEQYGVDIVFGGHDHGYQRTNKINEVVYIVTAGGGAPLYDVDRNNWTAYAEKTHHFCLVKIIGKKLIFKAVKPDGTIFDFLIIDKNSTTK